MVNMAVHRVRGIRLEGPTMYDSVLAGTYWVTTVVVETDQGKVEIDMYSEEPVEVKKEVSHDTH